MRRQSWSRCHAATEADFAFGDAAHIRSDHHVGRTGAKATGARYSMSLISAITSKGHLRFMINDKGRVNAAVFIAFLKWLLVGATKPVFLIVDRGPAYVAKKAKALSQR